MIQKPCRWTTGMRMRNGPADWDAVHGGAVDRFNAAWALRMTWGSPTWRRRFRLCAENHVVWLLLALVLLALVRYLPGRAHMNQSLVCRFMSGRSWTG
jgi:hypothetical protein